MLRQEIQKNEEEEAASTRERLFTPPSDSAAATTDENADDQTAMNESEETKTKGKEIPEDDNSESSEAAEEKIKDDQRKTAVENETEIRGAVAEDLHGSTVQIVQPADLKPKNLGFTRTLLLAMCAAMIGTGAQFGYAIGVMNAPSQLIKNFTKQVYMRRYNTALTDYKTDILYAVAISVIALGGVLGGLASMPVINRFGRKTGLLLNNIPAVIGSVLMVTSKYMGFFEAFIIGRILIGFSAGFGALVGPLYITEIAPLLVRGSFGACFQLFVAMAALLAQVLGLDIILGRENLWHYLFAVPIVFSVIQCVLLVFTHETPKFLLQRNRKRAAERAVKWFRRETDIEVVRAEILEMEADFHNIQTNSTKISYRDIWGKPLLRKSLLILAMSHAALQFSGCYVIFYFGNIILYRTNLPMDYTSYACLSFGITYLAVAISLVFILDKVGRRSLFLYGLVGMTAASCVIGVTILKSKNIRLYHMIFLEIFAMMTHTGFFAMGPGAIPWMLSTEMFFQSERGTSSAIAIIVNWLSMFCMVMSFIPLFYAVGPLLFLGYAAMCGLFWLLAFIFIPETRRKTPERVQILIAKGTVYKAKHQQ